MEIVEIQADRNSLSPEWLSAQRSERAVSIVTVPLSKGDCVFTLMLAPRGGYYRALALGEYDGFRQAFGECTGRYLDEHGNEAAEYAARLGLWPRSRLKFWTPGEGMAESIELLPANFSIAPYIRDQLEAFGRLSLTSRYGSARNIGENPSAEYFLREILVPRDLTEHGILSAISRRPEVFSTREAMRSALDGYEGYLIGCLRTSSTGEDADIAGVVQKIRLFERMCVPHTVQILSRTRKVLAMNPNIAGYSHSERRVAVAGGGSCSILEALSAAVSTIESLFPIVNADPRRCAGGL